MGNTVMKLIKKQTVSEMVTYSKSHIDRLEAAGKFPKRIRMGQGRVAWVYDEIIAYIEQLVRDRDSR